MLLKELSCTNVGTSYPKNEKFPRRIVPTKFKWLSPQKLIEDSKKMALNNPLNKLFYGILFMNNVLLTCMYGYIKKKGQGFYDK
jgi:hypothetical protein